LRNDREGPALDNAPTLTDYLGVLRRRWWIGLLVIVVAAGSAMLVSSLEAPEYQASAQVLAAQPLSTITGGQTTAEAARYAATQAQLASTAPIAQLALQRAGIADLTPADLLANSNVSASVTSDFLTFTVGDRSRSRATLLSNSYANAFADYVNSNEIKAIDDEIAKLQAQAEQARQDQLQAQYHQLLAAVQQLQITRYGHTNSTVVAQAAQTAEKVSPKTNRNVLMGLGIGLILGLALMSLAETLDRRVRNSDEIERRLDLHLLGRVPTPTRAARKAGGLGMLAPDSGHVGDIFHRLRVGLDFANLKARARTIMITSAVEREGKSTTAGNLAVALAGAGRRVALIDLDLRRPILAGFFDLPNRVGATDVLLGEATVEDALWPVPLADVGAPTGSLVVMPSGPMPPNPSVLFESDDLRDMLDEIAEQVDVVIVDSAPLLPVSDSVVLAGKMDGVVVIVRCDIATRPILAELQRTLADLPALKLGLVLTGAEHDSSGLGYGYGYGYGYGDQARSKASTAGATGSQVDGSSTSPDSMTRGEPKVDQS
jgi:capsular exopolysaccharide synthesis family protein